MAEARKYKVGLVQMRMGADPEANFASAVEHIREAARLGANIVCLPELFRAQYFCQREDLRLFDLAEPIPGPSTALLAEVARALRVAIIASLFERRAPGLYHNTAVTLNADGAIAGVYRKMHIPDDPLYHEKYYFTPGDLGFQAVDTAFGRVGALVCWDQWYPEAARIIALQGAEALFYPTAIGWHPAEKDEFGAVQYDAWHTIQRAHAIANGVYVAAVNRVGLEHGEVKLEHGDILGNRVEGPGIEFWGGSFLADPFGRVIAQASHDSEEILIGEIDLGLIEETRRNWPFLRDRRIDAYAPITKRFLDSDEKVQPTDQDAQELIPREVIGRLLTGNRYSEVEDVPLKDRSASTVYAFFLREGLEISPIEIPESRLIYVGRAQCGLIHRDHFNLSTTGSTLRRTLGAILHGLDLQAMPTRSNVRGKYHFGRDGEAKLSKWMKENLTFSHVVVDRTKCEWIEDKAIELLCPPLNLEGNPHNPQADYIEGARKACRDKAAKYSEGGHE
jgi:N-carbamoylputrescine amidase